MTADEAIRARMHQFATVDSGAPDFMLTMGVNYGQMRKALGAVLGLCDDGPGTVRYEMVQVSKLLDVVATALGVDP